MQGGSVMCLHMKNEDDSWKGVRMARREIPAWARQNGSKVKFEWGLAGVEAIAAEYVVMVDVLRFTTAVEAAVAAGAQVFPYRWKDSSANEVAERVGGILADGSDPAGPSLSPVRLTSIAPGTRVVLPSPNGSTCAAIASERGATVVASCLRNFRAVAAWLNEVTRSVAVVACGERWPDGSLRPSLEDFLGAAALVSAFHGPLSAEAEAAALAWNATADRVPGLVRQCASGRELDERGWTADLDYACQLDVSAVAPVLTDGGFRHGVCD